MDPFFRQQRFRPDTIIAYVVGVLVAFVLQLIVRLGGGALFTTLIIVGVGGLWYKWRNIY